MLRNEFVAFPIEGNDEDYTNVKEILYLFRCECGFEPDSIEASLLWDFYGVGGQHVAGVKSLFPDLLGTQSWRGIYTVNNINLLLLKCPCFL